MEPQLSKDTEITNQTSSSPYALSTTSQTAQISSPEPKRSRKVLVLSLIVLLLLVALGAGAYFASTLVSSANDKVTAAEAEKARIQTKLTNLEDELRKADLSSFINAVKQYKSIESDYPTTEPTYFKTEFSDIYIKSKVANFVDPSTEVTYEVIPVAKVQTPPVLKLGSIQYQWPGTCKGGDLVDANDDSKAAARILLGSGESYCIST